MQSEIKVHLFFFCLSEEMEKGLRTMEGTCEYHRVLHLHQLNYLTDNVTEPEYMDTDENSESLVSNANNNGAHEE